MHMHRTPLQLIDLRQDMIDPLQVNADYGVDPEAESNEANEVKSVNVDPLLCPVSNDKWKLFEQTVLPIDISFPKNQMQDYYMNALETLNNIDDNN